MAFDDKTRRILLKTVTACRNLLTEDFDEQLRGRFGIYADEGRILEIDRLPSLTDAERETARLLRERIDHLSAGKGKQGISDAVHRIRREQAFTVLNRFAALRMAEERGVIRPSVAQGFSSNGFRIFKDAAGGEIAANASFGEEYDRYLVYLDCLFDELSLDLGVLFDRTDAMGLLFPSENGLRDLFAELNSPSVAHLWAEDETIGWIYQYYNDPEERKRMRKESAAPRNSRELAVRNQFFTPRYVVEFLTDNTLGRIWYEMCQGQTKLKEQCRYLVRRPTEIFLAEGETAPEMPDQEGLSQEDLLKQPVHIPHRPIKDPREIRLLDPACGSMHFGLYAFDLFEVIYGEAWDNGSCPALQETYPSKEEFLKDVPRLIIEHNIHGVDIDPRAAQIAGLSLWLRAQKAWENQRIKPADRPQVRRSNIVCAEPMPGSPERLEEFSASLDPPLLGELVKTVFDKMKLAGEAGSLLKIEEEILTAIDAARKEWLKQQDDLLTRKDGSQKEFFDTAEEQVIDALRAYAEQADADSYQRRLFADDAARGFAFIDLCRKRYDAVVMNPPFGEFSKQLATKKKVWYPNTWQDILAAFTERFHARLTDRGLLGAITSRTGFFLPSLRGWREKFLLKGGNPTLLADLGDQVMDDATVESSAYILSCDYPVAWRPYFRLLGLADREQHLLQSIESHNAARGSAFFFAVEVETFSQLRQKPLAYWVPRPVANKLETFRRFVPDFAEARQGLVTGDADRFVRLFWEVPPVRLETSGDTSRNDAQWFPYVMRGSSQPWFSPLTVAVNWQGNGVEVRNFFDTKGELRSRPRAMDFYFRPGFSWTRRSVRFVPYIIPKGCIPSASRYLAFPPENEVSEAVGLAASNAVSAILRFYGEWFCRPNYLVEHLKSLPWPEISSDLRKILKEKAILETTARRNSYTAHEPFQQFLAPIAFRPTENLSGLAFSFDSLLGVTLDRLVAKSFGLDQKEQESLERDLVEAVTYRSSGSSAQEEDKDDDDEEVVIDDTPYSRNEASFSYFVGSIFGRWDIRYATGERQPPELPDPFDPLPVCPPGMLQNAEGLPAVPKDLPAEYPLHISWPGILVDDENHPEDIVARVREAIEVIWKDRAEAIEAEACEILGVKAKPKEGLDALRVYFRDPNRFFKDHLARYSKSRRKAPIYWPLSTDSGSYTLWIYCHRLNRQTLFTCIEMIDLKREDLGREIETTRSRIGTGGTAEERQKVEDQAVFLTELKTLRDRLLEVTKLPYHPDLNDGVQITAAPLWQCFRHGPWQKVLKSTWSELTKGKFDWAHLSMSIWPERVVPKCSKDRSLAIAHGIDDLLWVPDLSSKKKDEFRPLKSPDEELKLLKQVGHSKEDIDKAAEDVAAAEKSGLRSHLWIEQPANTWRRRKSPKEEIENEIARRRGR
jgi:hypothetical protein